MKRLLALAGLIAVAPATAQQPNWMSGVYTLAPGPDNLYTNLPPLPNCYFTAWVADRDGPGQGGMMVSDCVAWLSNRGAQGPAGPAGATGATGSPGAAATVSVGTVTTGLPGSSAIVTNSGTSSAAVLNYTIPRGDVGLTGSPGSPGAAGVNAFGAPTVRTVALATAYQASNPAKPALLNINLTSTANLSLSGGTTNSAAVVIGSTSAVAAGTGTVICQYNNASTGTLTIGLNTNAIQASTCSFALPVGWYWAVRTISGTITVSSAFDQVVG
jgi:hypothetical protein